VCCAAVNQNAHFPYKNWLESLAIYARSSICKRKKLNMNGATRDNIKPGLEVLIVLKKDQSTGKLTKGIVKDILTNSPTHPHGIKVRLQSGEVGRVKEILE
jgi:uncharacterized repeat protein (TIGR03833 family)